MCSSRLVTRSLVSNPVSLPVSLNVLFRFPKAGIVVKSSFCKNEQRKNIYYSQNSTGDKLKQVGGKSSSLSTALDKLATAVTSLIEPRLIYRFSQA